MQGPSIENDTQTPCSNADAHTILQKRSLNDLVPICRLLPELLSEVFAYYTASILSAPPTFGGIERLAFSRKWIRIAHVCHLWRQITLRTPTLWREFHVEDVDSAEIMLNRSKATPLRIAASCTDEQKCAGLNHVLRQLHRIEAIEFMTCVYADVDSEVQIGTYAPLLQSLVVAGTGPSRGPLCIFDHVEMPRLNRLHLLHSQNLWSSPLLKPTLTHLRFGESEISSNLFAGMRVESITNVLGSMENLRSLELSNVFPILIDDYFPPRLGHPAKLPHLQRLSLTASSMTCIHFFSYLSLPPTIKIALTLTDHKPTLLTQYLLPAIITVFGDSHSRWCPQSVLCHEGRVGVWTESLSLEHIITHYQYLWFPEQVTPTLELHSNSGPIDERAMFRAGVCQALPLNGVTTFLYASSAIRRVELQLETWIQLLGQMSSLRNLGIHGVLHGMSQLADAMAEEVPVVAEASTPNARVGSGAQLLIPALDTLLLNETEWRREPNKLNGQGVGPHFCHMLRKRQEQNCVLRRLILRDCGNFDQLDADSLHDLVDVLEWDGKEAWRPSIWSSYVNDFRQGGAGE